jgi:hypothetical protein
MTENCPAEQAAGNEQECEHRRHDSGIVVQLGEVDGVKVHAEEGLAEEDGRDDPASAWPKTIFFPRCNRSHRNGCDSEAVSHGPLRRHDAELAADHDPGRPPDNGEDDERDNDRLRSIGRRRAVQLTLSWTARFHPRHRLGDRAPDPPINAAIRSINGAYAGALTKPRSRRRAFPTFPPAGPSWSPVGFHRDPNHRSRTPARAAARLLPR